MPSPDPKNFFAATRDTKKIAVVDLGFLGDTVHMVPVLWDIKEHYPDAELHVLTSPLGKEVLQMAPCVDRTWAFPLGPPSPSWWQHWDVVRAMRREHFDIAINFTGSDRSVFVTAALGARQTIVYRGGRQHFWHTWLVRTWIPRTTLPSPVYEARRHIFSLFGVKLKPARMELTVPVEDQKWAREIIPANSVHLSLSASFALKEWPMANNLKLVRYLLAGDFNRKLVVTAAPNPREQARLAELQREIKDDRLLVLNERMTVARLAAMLQRCVLHIGPDSGMIHLAWAMHTATVAVFRRYSDMADFIPVGPNHVYFDVPCPCMNSKNPPCAATGEAACLASISPESVGAEIRVRLAAMDALVVK